MKLLSRSWLTMFLFLASMEIAEAQNHFTGAARAEAFARIEALKPIQSHFQNEIMNLPGVYAFGIALDTKSGQLIFQISIDQDARVSPPLPESLSGVPISIIYGVPPRPNNGRRGAACVAAVCHNDQLSLPVQMGNSGQTVAVGSGCASCTMGFKACEASTGTAVWVSAAHCASDATTCPGSAPIGSPAGHVSPGDTFFCGLATNVGSAYLHAPPVANGTVDATAIASDDTLTMTSVRDIGGVWASPATALPGDSVQKSGRTTGLTTGVVSSVNAALNVTYNCGTLTMTQQLQIDGTVNSPFSSGGDSGSGVFDFSSPTQIVGMEIAGGGATSFANDATNVLNALGLTMDFTDCIEDLCPAIEIASNTSNADRTLKWIRLLRDDVFAETPRGRSWITTYYEVSGAWLALYVKHPQLLNATKNSLLANLSVLDAMAHHQPITITQTQLNGVLQLVDQHAALAQGAALKAAFQMWRNQLNSAAVQAEFQVTVR
jgi:hypothetical protein